MKTIAYTLEKAMRLVVYAAIRAAMHRHARMEKRTARIVGRPESN